MGPGAEALESDVVGGDELGEGVDERSGGVGVVKVIEVDPGERGERGVIGCDDVPRPVGLKADAIIGHVGKDDIVGGIDGPGGGSFVAGNFSNVLQAVKDCGSGPVDGLVVLILHRAVAGEQIKLVFEDGEGDEPAVGVLGESGVVSAGEVFGLVGLFAKEELRARAQSESGIGADTGAVVEIVGDGVPEEGVIDEPELGKLLGEAGSDDGIGGVGLHDAQELLDAIDGERGGLSRDVADLQRLEVHGIERAGVVEHFHGLFVEALLLEELGGTPGDFAFDGVGNSLLLEEEAEIGEALIDGLDRVGLEIKIDVLELGGLVFAGVVAVELAVVGEGLEGTLYVIGFHEHVGEGAVEARLGRFEAAGGAVESGGLVEYVRREGVFAEDLVSFEGEAFGEGDGAVGVGLGDVGVVGKGAGDEKSDGGGQDW